MHRLGRVFCGLIRCLAGPVEVATQAEGAHAGAHHPAMCSGPTPPTAQTSASVGIAGGYDEVQRNIIAKHVLKL